MQHLKVNDKVQIKGTSRTGTVTSTGQQHVDVCYDDSYDHQWYHVDKLELIPSKEFKFKLGDRVQDRTIKRKKDGTVSAISPSHFTIDWVYDKDTVQIVYNRELAKFFELAKVEEQDNITKQKDIVYIELKNLCLVYIDNKMYDEAKEIIDVLHKLNKDIKLEIRGLS